MKTSKPLQSSAQEECGVWLDTVQLKGKAQKKRLTRPISKLLNPFVEGRGYSLAVALNFTQTKLEMPKTKQSSISTFFAGQRRVLNKMSTSEVPNMDPVQPSSPSTTSKHALTAPTPEASGTKRRREIDPDIFDFSNSEPGVDHESKSENVMEPEVTVWQGQVANYTSSQSVYWESEEEPLEEIYSPQRKRRLTAASQLPGDSQPVPQAWSQDPLLTCSQYSESEFNPTSQKNSTEKNYCEPEPSFLNSLQSEDVSDIHINMDGRTSTQKTFKHFHSSQTDDEKENSLFLSPKSPKKASTLTHVQPLSDHKWTEPKSVLQRKPVQLCKKADKEVSLDSQVKWIKPSRSPVKKVVPQLSGREADEDSLAMLFTQDSEGFRVIAHRGLPARSPLKDQSNKSSVRVKTSACRSLLEEEEEDDMLFTQDSQGNMVIKH